MPTVQGGPGGSTSGLWHLPGPRGAFDLSPGTAVIPGGTESGGSGRAPGSQLQARARPQRGVAVGSASSGRRPNTLSLASALWGSWEELL